MLSCTVLLKNCLMKLVNLIKSVYISNQFTGVFFYLRVFWIDLPFFKWVILLGGLLNPDDR